MTNDQLERLVSTLRREADGLWERMEEVNRQPTIQPHQVTEVAARTVGIMQGLAAAVEWHTEHEKEPT